MALIADEVFADYPLMPRADGCSMAAASDTAALTFSLGGLSKSAGLPQLKLGWLAVQGPAPLVNDALERLDLIGDTYLSVATPVQIAAPRLIEAGRSIRSAIASRLAQNLDAIRSRVSKYPALALREPEGGWSAVIQLPATHPEETVVLRALQEAHVIIHPGHFFDFAHEAFLVMSLLPPADVFAQALERVLPIAAGDAS
jgi:hypothetical protein